MAELEAKNAALKQDIVKLNDTIKLQLIRITKYETDEVTLKKLQEVKAAEWQTNLQSQKVKDTIIANQFTDLQ